jgi:hypothetical protein
VAKRRKGVVEQLIEAQQRKAKEKAAREKAERDKQEKADAAAAKEAAAEARRQKRVAEELERRKQTADARAVAQVLRAMDRRDEQRAVQEARDAKDKERQALAEARAADKQEHERARHEAAQRTEELNEWVDALGRILSDRDRDLGRWREHTDAAFGQGDSAAYAASVMDVLSRLAHLDRATVPVRPRTSRRTDDSPSWSICRPSPSYQWTCGTSMSPRSVRSGPRRASRPRSSSSTRP